jgi:hypothetical protein
MKTRTGFVSNSSSSSFVISAKKNATLKVNIEITLSPHATLKTKDEIKEHLMDEHASPNQTWEQFIEDDDGYALQRYDEWSAEIDKGNHIYIGSVSNQDEASDMFLYDHGIGDGLINKDAKVLQDCDNG